MPYAKNLNSPMVKGYFSYWSQTVKDCQLDKSTLCLVQELP